MPIKLPDGDARRPLTDLGIRQIEQLATRLHTYLEKPPFIVCSDALRAFTTASIIAKKWDLKPKSVPEIYYGGKNIYEKTVLSHLDNDNLILVGHNPDISIFGSEISGSDLRFLPGTCAEIQLMDSGDFLQGKLLNLWHPEK